MNDYLLSSVSPKKNLSLSARLPRGLIMLFATGSCLSVANVYYAQPLLDALSRDFNIGQGVVGAIISATQIGCALSLIFLVPLGDKVERRRLIGIQLLALVGALLTVSLAQSTFVLMIGMLAVGLLGTAMTQGLIAYAASSAAPHERGKVIGAAQSGVFIGLLMARVFAGAVSDLAGWRSVYLCAALLMLVIAWPLWRRLPILPVYSNAISYRSLITSMWTLLRQEKILQIRGILALLMFASFNIFWSALALPLSAPPYNFSLTAIGSFGLVGAIGALAASYAGRWTDQGYGQRTSAVALSLLLLAWWPLSMMDLSLWALVLGIVLLDLGGQALHVTNQSMIFRNGTMAHSRLVGIYMLFYAVGSGLGAISTTLVYEYAGWRGVCVLGASASLIAIIFWYVTRRKVDC